MLCSVELSEVCQVLIWYNWAQQGTRLCQLSLWLWWLRKQTEFYYKHGRKRTVLCDSVYNFPGTVLTVYSIFIYFLQPQLMSCLHLPGIVTAFFLTCGMNSTKLNWVMSLFHRKFALCLIDYYILVGCKVYNLLYICIIVMDMFLLGVYLTNSYFLHEHYGLMEIS